MGDSRRFDLFSKLISEYVPKDFKVVDVAGGKGYLQAAMRQLGYKNIVSWDKRKKYASNRRGYRYGYFFYTTNEQYDAVVAMHPDDGTDHAIMYAVKNRVIAIVCPCCIKPDACAYWGPKAFGEWKQHLVGLGKDMVVKKKRLRMNGKNEVLIFIPKEQLS